MNSVISCSVLVAGIGGNALGDRRILEPPGRLNGLGIIHRLVVHGLGYAQQPHQSASWSKQQPKGNIGDCEIVSC